MCARVSPGNERYVCRTRPNASGEGNDFRFLYFCFRVTVTGGKKSNAKSKFSENTRGAHGEQRQLRNVSSGNQNSLRFFFFASRAANHCSRNAAVVCEGNTRRGGGRNGGNRREVINGENQVAHVRCPGNWKQRVRGWGPGVAVPLPPLIWYGGCWASAQRLGACR